MDSGFNKNQMEFVVLVLAATFQMLTVTDSDSLLDHFVEILWDVGFQTNGVHDAEDFVSVDETDLSNSVGVARKTIPILDEVIPFLPNFLICSLTSLEFKFNYDVTERLYCKADWEIPFLKLKPLVSCLMCKL